MPSSTKIPPLGKSGPGRTAISSSVVGLGRRFFITRATAAWTSARLWVGMLVAMPTAIPVVPFSNRLGRRPGSETGSVASPS